jgi:hypothetical protein
MISNPRLASIIETKQRKPLSTKLIPQNTLRDEKIGF